MKNGIVRIKDIAEKAKVSIGTVDRVLHNRGKVAEDVKKRILKIIKDVNYEPNLIARALGTHKHKTFTIGALIPDHKYDSYWLEPRSGIERAEKEVKQYGVAVKAYLFDPHTEKSFVQKAEELTRSRHSGIIVAPIFYRQAIRFFKKWKTQNIPFVLFNTHITEHGPLSYIGQDSYQSGLLAGRLFHFANAKPCKLLIAHVDEELSNAAHLVRKEQGFRDYFRNLGEYEIIRVELDRGNMRSFNAIMDGIFRKHTDLKNIFVSTSKAFEIAAYLKRKKIARVNLIGFDILQENIQQLNNGFIHFLINQHPKGQGYWGVYLLTDHLVFKKEVPSIKYLPLDIVSKENVSYYINGEDSLHLDR